MNKHLPKIIFITLYSNLSFAEHLLNQDVDISSGSTLSSDSGRTITELSGGPYTIDNRGTIEGTNMTSNYIQNIRLEVETSVNNSGLIDTSGSANFYSILFTGTNNSGSLINSGTIQTETTGQFGQAITVNGASLTEITNSSGGTIKVTDSSYSSAVIRIGTTGSVNTITNNGTITAIGTAHSRGIVSIESATIDRINNTGTIQAQGGSETNYGIVFWNDSGTTVTNSGTIQGTGGTTSRGIHNNSNISSITNTGTIMGGTDGIGNDGYITTIVNTGTITGTTGYGINNAGSITNLTNSQNNLTYNGKLPTNYYVKINSSSSYGKITVSNPQGSMNFDITSDSSVTENQTYSGVIDGLTSVNLNSTSGSFINSSNQTYSWTLSNSSANLWDLIIGSCTSGCYPSTASTQTTINNISYGMSAQLAHFAMITNFANLNTYDCGLFDATGGCFSVGGRFTDVNANNNSDSDSSAIVMVGGYKINDHFRIAGFADQMVNNNTPSGIDMENKSPMVGLSLVWNQHPDHLGYQVKLANAYQDKDITITRTATGDAEAGSGSTDVSVQSYIAEVSYQFLSNDKTAYRPYFAGRYAKIKQDGYTETNVDNPLTYSTVEDESVTLIMGMKVKHALSPEIYLNGSLGVEHDVHNDVDNLSVTATNISGLTPVSVNSNINKTRGVASLGADYYLAKNQMLSLKTQFQELAYTHTNAKAAYLSYTIGF